ncbi:MAG: hypothetical protein QOG03_1182 [Actinomycetota bacterium]|nr:hypothetical protein [Actinomycetota bacterium]
MYFKSRTQRLRALARADSNDRREASAFAAMADILERATPLVVGRWGPSDGTALHARAFASRRFRVAFEALAEAKDKSASRWSEAGSNAQWAAFRLATRCHRADPVPQSSLTAADASLRAQLPILAVDVSTGGRLERLDATGAVTRLGVDDLRVSFPLLSPDGTTLVAVTTTKNDKEPKARSLSLSGDVQRTFPGVVDCVGWAPGSVPVLGRYEGTAMSFRKAVDGAPLPIPGGSCPIARGQTTDILTVVGASEESQVEVAVVGPDYRIRQRFGRAPCRFVEGQSSPIADEIVMTAACDDPFESGLWMAEPDGQLRHVLPCVCGPATFSPDGTWLAFAIRPLDAGEGSTDIRLGFARRDGSGAFYLDVRGLSFPMWTPKLSIAR